MRLARLAGLVVLASACGRAASPADSIALGGGPAKSCPPGSTWDGIECATPHSSNATNGAENEPGARDVVAASATSNDEDRCEGDECDGTTAAPTATTPEGTLMVRGLAAYNSHDFPKARKELYDLIQRYPNGPHVPDAYFWFGKMFEDEGAQDSSKYRLAIQAFEETQKYPQSAQAPAALLESGIIYGRMQETGKQKAAFANLRRRYPNSAAATKIPAGF